MNNYFNNIHFVQDLNSDYNEVFKHLHIYYDDTSIIPTSVATQIKLYQHAIEELVDTKQFQLLNNITLEMLEKVFGNVIKQKNIENFEEYYITSLKNEAERKIK